jgi:HemY protein
MIKLLSVLFFLLLGGVFGWLFLADSGYVLIAWQQSSIEMSLALAILLLVFTVSVGAIGLELVLGVFGLRALIGKWLGQRRHHRAQSALSKGLMLMATDDFKRAEKMFVRSAQLATDAFPAYLSACRAAQAQLALQRAEDYLVLAETSANRLTIQLTRARLWLDSGQWEAAVSILKVLYAHDRKEPVVAELLLQALIKLQSWQEIMELLPLLSKTLARVHISALLKEAYQRSLSWLAQTGNRVDKVATLKRLRDFWATLPTFIQHDRDVIHSYAEAVIAIGFEEEAEELVRVSISQQWHNGLVELYGRIRHSQPERSLQYALEWLKKHPQSPILLLTLGRLSMQNRQWQEAKAYFEQSLSLHKNTETYAEFVRLLQHLNDPEAGHYLIAGLNQLVTKPLPHLPLP